MATKRVIISRHVVFDETCFPFGLYPSRSSPSDLDFLLAGTTVPVRPASLPSAAGQSHQGFIEELTDDPAILFHGPVLPAAPPAAAPAPAVVHAAPPARDIRLVYSRHPWAHDGSSTAPGPAPAPVQQAPMPV